MANNKLERVLLVESDAEIRDLIINQTLRPEGYDVRAAGTASAAIQNAVQFNPELIVTNIHLPDLSGKDLLVALTSQGLDVPVVLIAVEGQESDVIDAFRLGATDYINWPAREAEILSVVERALKSVRDRKERVSLDKKLQSANQELQRRVRELTTITALGKAVTSITDTSALFNRILEGAVLVTDADRGWLLVQDHKRGGFVLRAERNMPREISGQINSPLDDGISNLVAMSGESLSVHGESLKRFKISRWGRAALVVPLKAKTEVLGILVVLRSTPRAFDRGSQTLLETVGDYASISMVNARLFQSLEARAADLQKALDSGKKTEKVKSEIIQNISHELRTPLVTAKGFVDMMVDGHLGRLEKDQRDALAKTQEKLQRIVDIIGVMSLLEETVAPQKLERTDVSYLVEQTAKKFKNAAERGQVTLNTQLPRTPVFATIDPDQIQQVFDHLVTNAIKFSPNGGRVTISVEDDRSRPVKVTVEDTGVGIRAEHLPHIFERFYQADGSTTRRFGGLGIGLAVAKEIITAHGGEIHAESSPKKGARFYFTLPR